MSATPPPSSARPQLLDRLPATIDWDQLRIFNTVAESGSFTRGAKLLNLSQSAVSRQISALESSLKVLLFRRHAGGIALTEMGAEFQRAVKDMSERLALALVRVNEFRDKPEGPLRVTTSVTFGSAWLSSRMNVFHARCPDVTVSLLLVDNIELDLLGGEADVAIRFSRQTSLRLVQRYLMSIRYHVFASRQYLEKHGIPKRAEDLDDHKVIVYGEEVPAPIEDINWLLKAGASPGKAREPTLRVNSVYGIYRAVLSGLGIAALPYYLSEETDELVEILPELEGPSFDVFYVYPEDLRHSKRVGVLRDFLVEEATAYRARIGTVRKAKAVES